ncbi:MAG: hypothetical protein IJY39_13390 [Clostridia bacterium]|nr:hypothetical protein [Clostridia bacterium]
MLLYLTVIIISIIITAGTKILLAPTFSAELAIGAFLSVTIGAVAAIAIDGLSALIIRRLTPTRWYSPDKRLFTVSKTERDFYNRLKIKAWKDLVPELGGFTSFHKDKLEEVSDTEYLGRFIMEANYGMVIHLANALLGFLVAFIPLCHSPSVWIPVFIVNFILSLLPIAILRYTCYTLTRLYRRSLKKAVAI